MSEDLVNSFFKKHYPKCSDENAWRYSSMLGGMREYTDRSVLRIFPRVECADGFTMSVQGHAGAYSCPRDDFADAYTSVEVGFPSAPEPLLMLYAEDPDQPTETVYGYVPVRVVEDVIRNHGGLKA